MPPYYQMTFEREPNGFNLMGFEILLVHCGRFGNEGEGCGFHDFRRVVAFWMFPLQGHRCDDAL